MWLPGWFRRLEDTIRTELHGIQEAINHQVQANRESEKAREAQWREVARIIIAAQRPAHNEIAEAQARYDQTYRQQERSIAVQRGLRLATWCAFAAATAAALGAFYYAAIAKHQACIMQQTYTEIQLQTKASEAANKIAMDALEAQTRPWVGIDTPLKGESVQGSQIVFEMTTRNSGPSPAQIAYHADATPIPLDIRHPEMFTFELYGTCGKALKRLHDDKKPNDLIDAAYPGNTPTYYEEAFAGMPEQIRGDPQPTINDAQTLLICVAYSGPSGIVHYTRAAYFVDVHGLPPPGEPQIRRVDIGERGYYERQ
jgi:hypothetical protein